MTKLFIPFILFFPYFVSDFKIKIKDYNTNEDLVGVYNKLNNNYTDLNGEIKTFIGDTLELKYISYKDTTIIITNIYDIKIKQLD